MNDARVFTLGDLEALLHVIGERGFRLIGPSRRDGAIVHAEIAGVQDLPRGWTEVQEAGTYRLERRSDEALFGYSLGPHSWKQFLFVPHLRLWQAQRQGKSFSIASETSTPPRLAFLGVRACELRAIELQDQIFQAGSYVDDDYASRRSNLLLLAVQCGQAGGTCFCASMQTGPRAHRGFDLALTEILTPEHHFVVEVGSSQGAELLEQVAGRPASAEDLAEVDRMAQATAATMGRALDTQELPAVLRANLEHPRWDEVASRCLACANCTMVCPTCFCSTVEDVSDLSGEHTERWRRWDSCFTADHSYVHGGSVRASTRSRYRQWLTHKLGTWVEQFGSSGCVGCGRCITWCPVGIDLTLEVAALRTSTAALRSPAAGSHAAKPHAAGPHEG